MLPRSAVETSGESVSSGSSQVGATNGWGLHVGGKRHGRGRRQRHHADVHARERRFTVAPMAVRLGYDAPLLAAVAGRLARAVMQDMRRGVKQQHGLASVAALHAGVVTVVQRFRSDLGLYVHLHCLVTDGAYEEQDDGELRFLAAPPPTPVKGRVH